MSEDLHNTQLARRQFTTLLSLLQIGTELQNDHESRLLTMLIDVSQRFALCEGSLGDLRSSTVSLQPDIHSYILRQLSDISDALDECMITSQRFFSSVCLLFV